MLNIPTFNVDAWIILFSRLP